MVRYNCRRIFFGAELVSFSLICFTTTKIIFLTLLFAYLRPGKIYITSINTLDPKAKVLFDSTCAHNPLCSVKPPSKEGEAKKLKGLGKRQRYE